jgi:hypothetical protein
MRAIGTYFEQVPKTVVEKILAQQIPPPEVELAGVAAVNKRAASKPASKAPNETKSRKPSNE